MEAAVWGLDGYPIFKNKDDDCVHARAPTRPVTSRTRRPWHSSPTAPPMQGSPARVLMHAVAR